MLKEKMKEKAKKNEDDDSEEEDDSLSDPLDESDDSELSESESSPEKPKKGKTRMKKLRKQIEGTARYAPLTPARGRKTVASYMLNQVLCLQIILMNVTLIAFITGEVLRAKRARQQRKGKNMMGKEDLSIALTAIAKEAAKKAAKEATKEMKKKK